MTPRRNTLQSKMETVETSLQEHGFGYRMDGQICGWCGFGHSSDAKECIYCRKAELLPEYCSRESRIAQYFSALRYAELWPFSEALRNSSISDITSRICRAVEKGRHDCAAKRECPLKWRLRDLSDVFFKVREDVSGFCLRCLKQERVSTLYKDYSCIVCGTQ